MINTPETYSSNEITEYIKSKNVKKISKEFLKTEKVYSFIFFGIAFIIMNNVVFKEMGIISTLIYFVLNTMAIIYLKKKKCDTYLYRIRWPENRCRFAPPGRDKHRHATDLQANQGTAG